MQVGLIPSVRTWSHRNLWYAAAALALVAIATWLIANFVGGVMDHTPSAPVGYAAVAALVSLAATVWLWRSPLSRTVHMMTTPALRQTLATHHAGHIVAIHLQDPASIHRVDIGQPCAGHASVPPAVTQSALRGEMTVALAGLIAEEVFAGETGSHAADDLARVTNTAADMVGRFGMSGSLVSLGSLPQRRSTFLDRVLEDPRARKELEALLREVKHDTVRSMLENRHIIIAVRDALMRRSRLSAGQIREIIAGAERVRHTDDEVLVDLRLVGGRPAVG